MSREQEYVLRTVEERGVRLIRLWFTDVLGQLKSVAISPAELDAVFEEGVQFDGTAIDGFSRVPPKTVAGTASIAIRFREEGQHQLQHTRINTRRAVVVHVNGLGNHKYVNARVSVRQAPIGMRREFKLGVIRRGGLVGYDLGCT